ncbi:MAG: Eco57I restriction-modification methylase domain-containing protein, partial [Bacteroidales bacterium]|nr:Eco57I restriction-modification methylase domain-containing protein [Bacteroidales bacterium]
TEIEHSTLFISQLRNDKAIPVYSQTVLRDDKGKKRTGEINPLEYMFEFLNAYDFTSEGGEEIQEDNKTLINASVLGLIFEKINGYKDGSFFTPGFITMYMCRETIRKAVIQKFNETKGWNCTDIDSLYDNIEDRTEANEIVNGIKICDPAVGSGHFLVSALNEMIAIKSELGILLDINGRPLRDIQAEVINDELHITDTATGELFYYQAPAAPRREQTIKHTLGGDSITHKPEKLPYRQIIQQSIFNEKRHLIENCLFGVDINPNSVKICRLRLWIELLKNAYYTSESNYIELETLPNIDINIKCGNSLISRYSLDASLKTALRNSKWSIDSYRTAISTYRSTTDKNIKRDMEKLILNIKQDFTSEIRINDPLKSRLDKLANELYNRFTGNFLFEPKEQYSKREMELEKKRKKVQEKLEKEIEELNQKIEEIKSSKIYENAFEWRFEFPEVLDDNGDFVGFDVVIGNPPYVNFANLPETEREFYNKFELYKNKTDLYAFFVGLGAKIKNQKGFICLIIPHTWVSTTSFLPLRKLLFDQINLMSVVELDFGVFKDAYVKTVIIQTDNKPNNKIRLLDKNFVLKAEIPKDTILKDEELKVNLTWNPVKHNIYTKIKSDATKLGDIVHFSRGIKTSNDSRFLFKENKGEDCYKVIRGRNIKAYRIDYDNEYIWYRPDLMKEKAGCLPHTKELFITPGKIITQRVNSSGQLLATYDDEQYFCLDTTNISSEIIDKNCDLKFIVGIINSKLINWWFNDEFKNPTISGYELHQIPIKRDKEIEQEISKLVTAILGNNRAGKDIETFVTAIDTLVYRLYGLTEEETEITGNSAK